MPTDRPSFWFGLPLLALVVLVLYARSYRVRTGTGRSMAVVVFIYCMAIAGVLTLIFFLWLFWQFGQGMQEFE